MNLFFQEFILLNLENYVLVIHKLNLDKEKVKFFF